MITDWLPTVHDDDDYIREWALARSMDLRHPKVQIPLAGGMLPSDPDTAEIDFTRSDCPVRRFKRHIPT